LIFTSLQGPEATLCNLLTLLTNIAEGAIQDGRTAIEGAAKHGRLDMLQLLLHRHRQPDNLDSHCEKTTVLVEKKAGTKLGDISVRTENLDWAGNSGCRK